MNFTKLLTAIITILTAIFIGITPTYAATSQLQQDADAVHAIGAVSVLAGVLDHGTATKVSSGEFLRGSHIIPSPDSRFRAGSLTKIYVAAVALQLVGEGKLSLDDTVEKWLPGAIKGNGNDGTKIKVRDVLGHTSGLFDYASDNKFIPRLLDPTAFYTTTFNHYAPQDLINVATSHAPNFAPGTAYAYSNTDYIVAGEIIKKVTGNTWDIEIKNRITTPLGLTSTSYPGDDPSLPWPYVFGYNIYTSDPATRAYTDTTFNNMTWAGAAGGLISTTSDINKFMSGLLSGKILKPAQLALMKNDIPQQPGVGIGMGHQTLSCGVTIYGHTGKVIGYAGYALATGDGGKSVAEGVATTTFTEPQFYNDEAQTSGNLLTHVFCPPASSAAAPKSIQSGPLTLPQRTPAMNRIW